MIWNLGAIAVTVKKFLNPTFKWSVANYLWGYVLILIGAGLTFCVQSSSVFTSTLTPLVGIGLLEVETVYPLFLGSNIGTTTTGMLSALATTGTQQNLEDALTIAFVHLFFNLFGIAMFYPIKFMRFAKKLNETSIFFNLKFFIPRIPIPMCKLLGRTTAKYRWFAIAYLIVMFVVVPVTVMALSLDTIVFACVMTPLAAILVFVVAVNFAQAKPYLKDKLPRVLRDWEWLPKPLHSLGYWDRYFPLFTNYRKKCIGWEFETILFSGKLAGAVAVTSTASRTTRRSWDRKSRMRDSWTETAMAAKPPRKT